MSDDAMKCLRRAVMDMVNVKTYQPGEVPMAMLTAEARATAVLGANARTRETLRALAAPTARAVVGGPGPDAEPAPELTKNLKQKA